MSALAPSRLDGTSSQSQAGCAYINGWEVR